MIELYLPEADIIYFPKTREYFQEVISSYTNGNYRSAVVMLYSVAICDILFKLQELRDMYDDTVAKEILQNVEKSRNGTDNKSKSKWEKELVDDIYKRTQLLDLEAYTNLNHLYDHRNFSAHPALNDNYELISPSKETTMAHIKNTLVGILIKPPIFIKNIVDLLTDDLRTKREIYLSEYDKLQSYLNNKYFSKMTVAMKIKLFTTMWKFCFCMPDDEQCRENLKINRKALQILTNNSKDDLIDYVSKNSDKFTVSTDKKSLLELVIYLSHCTYIYKILNEDIKLHIDSIIEKSDIAKTLSWFTADDLFVHLQHLKGYYNLTFKNDTIKYLTQYYKNNGHLSELLDYFIYYYGESGSFSTVDERYEDMIKPNLNSFDLNQLIQLVKVTNENNQIYRRWGISSINTKIAKLILTKTENNFDFSKYENFSYDEDILKTSNEETENEDEE